MASSLQARADAARAAVASTSTCTPATIVILRTLLLPDSESPSASLTTSDRKPKSATSSSSSTSRSKTANGSRAAAGKGRAGEAKNSTTDELSAKEKANLATEIINVGLKALSEAAKPAAPAPVSPAKIRHQNSEGELRHRTLRRSSSMPLSPIQPRTLNRTATSPSGAAKLSKTPAKSDTSVGCHALVECLRIAFSCLAALHSAKKINFSEARLEAGISSFVSKLVALGLVDQALKELRVLKVLLKGEPGEQKKRVLSKDDATTASKAVAEILDMQDVSLDGPRLALAISTQLLALRVILALKKPACTEAAVPFLLETCPTAPSTLLLESVKRGTQDTDKAARQLDTLSKLILSLSPSQSSKDDSIAREPRLSPSAKASLELHALGIRMKLEYWRLAKHTGDVDKDILMHTSRCLSAFTRRSTADPLTKYQTVSAEFDRIFSMIKSTGQQPQETSKSPIASVYQVLGSAAEEARQIIPAAEWIGRLKGTLRTGEDSVARCCSVGAQLLSLHLKSLVIDPCVGASAKDVVEGMQGTLRGDAAELEDLMINLTKARRSAVGLLARLEESTSTTGVDDALKGDLRMLVLHFPRFSLRWLGKAPARDASPKEVIRYEQRRQLLGKTINAILDGTLAMIKRMLDDDAIEWSRMDGTLQDCTALLDAFDDLAATTAKKDIEASYYVKISHLYYLEFATLRRKPNGAKDVTSLRALRRSIDAVRSRSLNEKDNAKIVSKLEKLADLCKEFGRPKDARESLQAICTSMVEESVLAKVAAALSEQSPAVAWALCDKTKLLSRTLCSMAKVDQSFQDWTFFLPEVERAAVLEHLLYIITPNGDKVQETLSPSDPSVEALLAIYTAEKYPIRRLRTLLHLLSMNVDNPNTASPFRTQADATLKICQAKDYGEDATISRFLPHLQTYYKSLLHLADAAAEGNIQRFDETLATWDAMVDTCENEQDLLRSIDNPTMLLTHLRSVSQLASFKGESHLLQAALELSAKIARFFQEPTPDSVVLAQSLLANHYVNLGQCSKAQGLLAQAHRTTVEQPEISPDAMITFQLSQAEYLISAGDMVQAELCLTHAQLVSEKSGGRLKNKKLMIALTALFRSAIAIEQGKIDHALSFARVGVRILFHDWSRLEQTFSPSQGDTTGSSTFDGTKSLVEMKTSIDLSPTPLGSQFWVLSHPLLRCMAQLSSVYALLGMFKETLHYAQQAQKIASSTGSSLYQAQTAAWLASIWSKSRKVDTAREMMLLAKSTLPVGKPTQHIVALACKLSEICLEIKDYVGEKEWLDNADELLVRMSSSGLVGADRVDPSEGGFEEKTSKPSAKGTRARATTTSKKAPAKKPSARKTPTATKTSTTLRTPLADSESGIASLQAQVLVHKALSLLKRKDWQSALAAIEESQSVWKQTAKSPRNDVAAAMGLIGQSMELMIHDPVFSVVQDSTISVPAVSGGADRSTAEKATLAKTTPPRKGRGAAAGTVDRSGMLSRIQATGFVESLRQAQERLLEAHAVATVSGDTGLVHRVSALLQTTVILLSATSTTASGIHYATCSMELARNVTWWRTRRALQAEKATPPEKIEWPVTPPSGDARRSSLGSAPDMARFQRDHIDILPTSWSVFSVSLSDDLRDLCITKLQAGHGPFVLRLPLDRANSRDADTEVFNFKQGKAELLELIKLSNDSCHTSKRDFTAKGAKTAWWAEREELDDRWKSLLDNVEQIWLGGFKGIFSQHQRRTDLLARFQKSFHDILEKHLPSRRQVIRGKKGRSAQGPAGAVPRVTLDPRILDLFIGLGDPTIAEDGVDVDMDEALNDLLYFVVDVLQFHGERNAYDEIDFDAMVVETVDALHSYHAAAKTSPLAQDGHNPHSILVLDKQLHAFPWESLPCLQGLAVSRVPSLACLRRLILDQQNAAATTASASAMELGHTQKQQNEEALQNHLAPDAQHEGHHLASASSGTYILNPSTDLVNTLATFREPLKALEPQGWRGIVSKPPTEAEWEQALTGSDVVLYFGHGSGVQYMRYSTIRRLERCRATVLLMGCSSASLADVGEFECHGPVWDYMLAGCPAVVGTLWDVTDRDIDRFAGKVLGEWGLVEKGTFEDWRGASKGSARGKGKERDGRDGGLLADGKGSIGKGKKGSRGIDGTAIETTTGLSRAWSGKSLVEAVANSRDACRFRYLNAGAVCVYGIPVYLRKD